jgi:hypothetical protein
MDYSSIVQFISNVGFPIACCCYLMYANEKLRGTIEENTKTIAELKTLFTTLFKEKGE